MEEMQENQVNLEPQNTDINYIDAIKQLKSNSVSKDDYNKLLEQNRQLTDALVNGQTSEPSSIEEPKTATADLRKKLFGEDSDLSNLEYCKTALELRKNVMEETGQDIFVANNHQISGTQFDYDAAERVATIMQECIDYAQGDSEAFTNELMRRTNDVSLPRTGR